MVHVFLYEIESRKFVVKSEEVNSARKKEILVENVEHCEANFSIPFKPVLENQIL